VGPNLGVELLPDRLGGTETRCVHVVSLHFVVVFAERVASFHRVGQPHDGAVAVVQLVSHYVGE